jgi:hypothetical protein
LREEDGWAGAKDPLIHRGRAAHVTDPLAKFLEDFTPSVVKKMKLRRQQMFHATFVSRAVPRARS